jgi:hypothetical protein
MARLPLVEPEHAPAVTPGEHEWVQLAPERPAGTAIVEAAAAPRKA